MNALQDFAVLGIFTSGFCALFCVGGWIAEKINIAIRKAKGESL